MMGPGTPFYAGLLEDPRSCDAAAQIYGDNVLGMMTDGNRYIGNSGWHPDHKIDPTEDCYGVKFTFYLEPVDGETGALRLIPRSHTNPYHDEVRQHLNEWKPEINEVPSYICESEPGDVVAFDVRTWHASWGGATDPRMSTVVYYNNSNPA